MRFVLTAAVAAITAFITPNTGRAADIVDTAVSAGQFKTLAAALGAADLVDALKGSGPFTVFAPTDEAFAKLPDGTVESLLKPENKDKLIAILKYHVIAGSVDAKSAVAAEAAPTLQGEKVSISIEDGRLMANKSKIIKTDLKTSNGIIHVIDSVLLPPEPSDHAAAKMMKPAMLDPAATLRGAIAKGVPLFNSGHHQACADVYEKALMTLVQHNGASTMTSEMQNLVNSVQHTTCPTTKAWALRRGMDRMIVQADRDH